MYFTRNAELTCVYYNDDVILLFKYMYYFMLIILQNRCIYFENFICITLKTSSV